MPWKDVSVTQRVYSIDPNEPAEWDCRGCGFHNKPRPVTNSLNSLPPGHPLFDAGWRLSHCEQCGAERPE